MAEILNEQTFEERLNSVELLVVDFYAEWCGPCKVLGPIVDQVASEENDGEKVAVTKLNVDETSTVAVKYGVRSIPTIIFFKNGEEVKRLTGLQSKSALVSEINSLK